MRSKKIFLVLFSLFYVLLCGIIALGAIAPWMDVNLFPPLQFLSVFILYLFPFHLIAVFILANSSRYWVILAVIMSLVSAWVISKEYRFGGQGSIEGQGITVASLNVRNFSYSNEMVEEVVNHLRYQKADIVCVQEFRDQRMPNGQKAKEYLAEKLGLPHFRFVTLPVHIHGAAIFSRYPIADLDTLYMTKEEINSGILAHIEGPQGIVGVANLHMSSFHASAVLKKGNTWRDKLSRITRQASKVLQLQQVKANMVLDKLAKYPYPHIIAADMNGLPHTHVVNLFHRKYQDAFLEAGSGLGWTYPLTKRIGIRIDYQFASPELKVTSHKVVPSSVSDHYMIVSTYQLNP